MALAPYKSILITTVGGPTSNSFGNSQEISAALANAPFDASGWEDIGAPAQDQHVILAAYAMDLLLWRGRRTFEDQALCWPRNMLKVGMRQPWVRGVYSGLIGGEEPCIDPRDVPDEALVIPSDIKEAQAWIAWLVIHRMIVSMTPPEDGPESPNIASVSLPGVVHFSFSNVPIGGSTFNQMITSSEFPIFMKIAPYISRFRSRGSGVKPKTFTFSQGAGGASPTTQDGSTRIVLEETFVAAENIAAFQLCYIDPTNGKARVSTMISAETQHPGSIATRDVLAESPGQFVTFGVVSNPAWDFERGQDVYLYDDGHLRDMQPDSGIVQPVGTVLADGHTVFFNFQQTGWGI